MGLVPRRERVLLPEPQRFRGTRSQSPTLLVHGHSNNSGGPLSPPSQYHKSSSMCQLAVTGSGARWGRPKHADWLRAGDQLNRAEHLLSLERTQVRSLWRHDSSTELSSPPFLFHGSFLLCSIVLPRKDPVKAVCPGFCSSPPRQAFVNSRHHGLDMVYPPEIRELEAWSLVWCWEAVEPLRGKALWTGEVAQQ